MDLPYELFIAVRYLLARRKQAFISLISLISVIGVSVGVMALLIALALMTGLQGELRDRLVGSAAHVYVFKAGGFENMDAELDRLRGLPRVTGAAPVMLGLGMVQAGDKSLPITMKGVVPELESEVTEIRTKLQAGSFAALEVHEPGQMPGILLGRTLAENLGVYVGDSVQVLIAEGRLTPFGVIPQNRVFKVAGIFNLGLYEYDAAYGFVHLGVAEQMFGRSTSTFIELRVDDLYAAPEVAQAVSGRLGPEYQAQDWADMNKSLFSALRLEKMAISVTIGLIVMVAALNIVASLILLVMEKSRDIAILKTMGSSSASIRRIFVLQGLVIGVVGTAAGAVAGIVLIWVMDRFKLISVPIDVYQISHVPFRLEVGDAIVVIVAAVLICFVATIYPSRQASKLDPAQALRYQ
jgi:lipoprotein-releasing system permease protein